MSVPVLELEESAVTDCKVDLHDSFALTNFAGESGKDKESSLRGIIRPGIFKTEKGT